MSATQTMPSVDATPRAKVGTRECNRLRQAGKLPAVIYGHQQDPVHVTLNYKQITDLLHHNAHVIEINLEGASEPCLIKEVQWNHLGNKIVHLDLARISLDERVTVEIEIEFVGDPIGLKDAGTILEHPLTQLEIECLATAIPEKIRVDVSGLNAGDSLMAADVVLPEGITLVTDPETVVAAVSEVSEEPEPEVAEADSAEPEVISERKTEGDEDED